MKNITVKIKSTADTAIPAYATAGASGMDIRASESAVIKAHTVGCVPTGLFMEIPEGFEAQIRPRSGLALKNGITVLNTPGTIDSDYRGELKIILANLSDDDFAVSVGDRIAQMVFAEVTKAQLVRVEALEDTARSTGGFGSTGRR